MLMLALATIGLTLATSTSAPSVNSTPATTLNSTTPTPNATTTAGPGDTLFTHVYQTCNHTFPANDSRVCLTPLGHPGTLCRKPDIGCATGERVASSLHTWSDEHSNCSTYAWTWRCSGITEAPTFAPTPAPTAAPTALPTHVPTALPTHAPTLTPTPLPSTQPPTRFPTPHPTTPPTLAPTTISPTLAPTVSPTALSSGGGGNDDGDGSRLGIQWYWWVIIGVIVAAVILVWVGYDCYKYNKEQQRVSPVPPRMQEGGASRMLHNEIYSQPAARPLPDPPQQQPDGAAVGEPTVYVTQTIPEHDVVEV